MVHSKISHIRKLVSKSFCETYDQVERIEEEGKELELLREKRDNLLEVLDLLDRYQGNKTWGTDYE